MFRWGIVFTMLLPVAGTILWWGLIPVGSPTGGFSDKWVWVFILHPVSCAFASYLLISLFLTALDESRPWRPVKCYLPIMGTVYVSQACSTSLAVLDPCIRSYLWYVLLVSSASAGAVVMQHRRVFTSQPLQSSLRPALMQQPQPQYKLELDSLHTHVKASAPCAWYCPAPSSASPFSVSVDAPPGHVVSRCSCNDTPSQARMRITHTATWRDTQTNEPQIRF